METYNYNYNYQQIQIPKNFPVHENPINVQQTNYIKYENVALNNYQSYEIKNLSERQNELLYSNNIDDIQPNDYINNINYQKENNLINNEKKAKKKPEDGINNLNKIPKDSIKPKVNIVYRNTLKRENHNKINRINILENKFLLKNTNNSKEKVPKDNYKKYPNNIQNGIKKKKLNIKLNIKDNNANENNNYKTNYLKTSQNYFYEFNPRKTTKKNSIKTIERIKNNNLISINDNFTNRKSRNSSNPKDTKNKNKNNQQTKTKTANNKAQKKKLNLGKKEIQNLNKNYSTNKLKEKSDSNFASLINQKKIKMFSSFKLVPNNNPINSNDLNKNDFEITKPKKKPPKNIRTIGINNNNYGRLYSPQLTSPSLKEDIIKKEVETKKTRDISNKNKTNNKNKKKKELQRTVSYNKNTAITAKKKFSSNNNKNSNLNKNLKNRASSFRTLTDKNNKFSQRKKTENDLNKKENESEDNYDIMSNFIQRAYAQKTNDLKNKKKKNIIRKHLSLSISKNHQNRNDENNNNWSNQNTTRLLRKNVIYTRDKNTNDKKELVVNQKRNYFSFMKKTNRKTSNHSFSKLSEEKFDMHNKSYKGFSSVKKLEEIKKKYKFYPHNKESKNALKNKNIDYNSESNGFIKLMNSMNLNKPSEVKDLNLTEFLPQKEIINKIDEYYEEQNKINENEENNIKIIEKEEEKEEENEIDEIKEENENDILNRKSFILDLNNVIPINEKQLRATFKKEN